MSRRERPRRIRSEYGAGREIEMVGLPRRVFVDAYHSLLTASWPKLALLAVVVFGGANLLFALGYVATRGVEGARPGSFADAFFFSVQTMATIGYGKMAPVGSAAHVLVSLEALTGLFALAFMTSLFFAKFARPTSRVLFSRVMVVSDYDGVPSLQLRMGNARANQIVEARLRVAMVRNEQTIEGSRVRRVHDLPLRRHENPLFALSWTAIHPITPESPLYGQDGESCRSTDTDVVVTLFGFDESLGQTIHARHAYRADEILWGRRFVDIFGFSDHGLRIIDYRRFHDVEPAPVTRPERRRDA